MHHIRLILWNPVESEARADQLRAAGYEVVYEVPDGSADLRELWENPPTAIVIDLGRRPSQGRDLAVLLRRRKATRYLPLILVGGDVDKVSHIREVLPDAVYTTWDQISSLLGWAIAHPPTDPLVPQSDFAAYAGVPLQKKLGITQSSVITLVNAPDSIEETLGILPQQVTVHWQLVSQSDLVIWFALASAELQERMEEMRQYLADKGRLWICWPKKSSGVASDLSQTVVRKVGLNVGLVDHKVSAIDETWSGLLFSKRRVN